ncbi:MAG: bifunctional class I SAM-dependent methyltransferase/glycosyltransferase family 2 protein [Flavobacteriales bacterium]|nr:bifunctional class I SAM-dependent methyltransferase/glycosyltransferase family 2 protein [Flavobacteriales bacterium]
MKNQIKAYFDRIASQYSRYRKRYRYYFKEIQKYNAFFINSNDSVLEIGCGVGTLIGSLSNKNRIGIDFSSEMIRQAKVLHPDVRFLEMDAAELDIEEKVDVILLSNVLGYLEDIQTVLTKLHTVCHPKTKIIITNYNYLWEPLLKIGEFIGIKKKSPLQSWLSNNDIVNFLKLSDFDVYKHTRRMLLPVNIPILSWISNRFFAHLPLINHFCINQYFFAKPIFQEKTAYSTSVVIPARNESGNIENAILRTPKFGSEVEIIFIEGNSTDDTWDKIQEIAKKYEATHNIKIGQQDGKGKGDAVRKGYGMATGDILMILDADLTVPPEDLPKFYEALVSGKGEFINGCRLIYPMEKEAMRFLNTLGNKFFSLVFSWLLNQPIKDTLCGTKVLFKKDYLRIADNRDFFGEFDPFGDFDLLFGAYKQNLKIIDLPIRYRERTYGDTNISRFRHGLILLRMWLYACKKIKFF